MQNFLGMYPSGPNGFRLPAGDALVNHIHVADVARALAAVVRLLHRFRRHVHGDGSAATELGRSGWPLGRGFESVTNETAREEFLKAGGPAWLVDILLELFAAFRTGAVGMKTSSFEDLTGQKPRDFEAFAAEQRASRAADETAPHPYGFAPAFAETAGAGPGSQCGRLGLDPSSERSGERHAGCMRTERRGKAP